MTVKRWKKKENKKLRKVLTNKHCNVIDAIMPDPPK